MVLQALLGAAHHLQAEVVVLVDRADLLQRPCPSPAWHAGADLVVVGRRERDTSAVRAARTSRAPPVTGRSCATFFSNWTGIAAIVCRRADGAERGEDLVLVDQLLRGEHRLLRVVAVILDHEPQLAAVDAALLVDLVDAHAHAVHAPAWRSRRSARTGPARCRRRSRSADTPCCASAGAAASSASVARARDFIGSPISCVSCGCCVWSCAGQSRLPTNAMRPHAASRAYIASISSRYFSFTSLRLSFIVGVSSSSSAVSCCSSRRNLLDLLDARELRVHAVDLALDQLLHLRRAGTGWCSCENGIVVVLREFLDVLVVDHDQRGEVGAPVADHHRVGDVGRELQLVLDLATA